MMKTFLWMMAGIIFATLVFGTPPAYAIFGIRAARTVIAARKASQAASSSDSTPDEKAYAEEKARFNHPAAEKDEAVGPRQTQVL